MTYDELIEYTKPPIDLHQNFLQFNPRTEDTEFIVVHCSATQNKEEYDWKTIDQIHRQRGFLAIGYHYVIKRDGTIQNGRDEDAIGAHAKGYNNRSVGICLIGGIDRKGAATNNFTKEQMDSLKKLLDYLCIKYPKANVKGHRDLPNVAKECPCFNVGRFYTPPKIVNYARDTFTNHNVSLEKFKKLNGTAEISYGDLVRVK